MATPFAFDREWHFGASSDDLWDTLARTDRYRSWWPWLRELEVDGPVDGEPLAEGTVADFVIQAPLPYQLRGTIAVVRSETARLLEATVTGDLEGPARLELESTASGSAARLAWTLEVRSSLLRPLATVARPALSWAHDRIVERGLAQFEQHALEEPKSLD